MSRIIVRSETFQTALVNLCKIVIKIMDKKVKKGREVCCVIGCGNNKKNSPDRIFYSFSIKKHKLGQREKWIKAVVRST